MRRSYAPITSSGGSGRRGGGGRQSRSASSVSEYSRSAVLIGAGPSRRRPCRRACSGGQAEDAFGDDVAQDLGRAALDRVALRAQVAVAGSRPVKSTLSGRRMVQSSYRSPASPWSSMSRPEMSARAGRRPASWPEPSGPGCPAASCCRRRSPVSRATSASTHSRSSSSCMRRVAQFGSLAPGLCDRSDHAALAGGRGTADRDALVVEGRRWRPASPGPRRRADGSPGMRTSVRNTSLNSASPVICRSGRTSMPGSVMSQRK